MVKVHARGCSEDRTASALALASACFAVTPEPAKAEATTDFDRIMESANDAVYAQLDFFLENGVVFDERTPEPGALTSPTPDQIAHMEASGLECFTREDIPDALTSTQDVAQDNSIFLAVFKNTSDGARDWGIGTGTLIKSESGQNRILTADHVALFKK